MAFINSAPLSGPKNAPLENMSHVSTRKYIRGNAIVDLAIKKYEINGRGITYPDLITNGFSKHKNQAQRKLKYLLSKNKVFTIENCKPQHYYPYSIKSKIMRNRGKKGNVPIGGTGLGYSGAGPNSLDEEKIKSTYEILNLLEGEPLHLHKIRIHTNMDKTYYNELERQPHEHNKAKVYEEHVGKAFVRYVYSPNGKVEIQISCSEDPFRIESETDEIVLYSFLGQVRDRMILHLYDHKERAVKPLMDWVLVQADLNKDVEVGNSMQFSFPSVQLKHMDKVFRLYIKALPGKTVCRCEECIEPKLTLSEGLLNIRVGPPNQSSNT